MSISSGAIDEFTETLDSAQTLLELNDEIENNSELRDILNLSLEKIRKSIIGLRQGILILGVTGFENFLRKLPESHFETIIPQYTNFDFSKLPRKMQINNIYKSLALACEGIPYMEKKSKFDRLEDIYSTCTQILNNELNFEAFSSFQKVPKSDVVKMLFNQIGKTNVFQHIFEEFQTDWGEPIAEIFIEGKLDEIIQKRNLCAHGDANLVVSKEELVSYLKYFEILSKVLNNAYHATLTSNLIEASE